MFAWLLANLVSVAAALVIALIAGLAIAYLINKKKNGKSSCGCGCNCSCCGGECDKH